MAKNQSEYFEEKHVWSRTKDSILSCYLTPFFQKVMTASPNGIVYVDGFSGAGKFEAESLGRLLSLYRSFERRTGKAARSHQRNSFLLRQNAPHAHS